MQNHKPLAFFSKCLGPRTQTQSIYGKEALAILWTLKQWRHYFLGNHVIIKTDQQSLKYLGSQRLVEGIQHKLMLKLLEFDYTIEYKKGKENAAADALSRKFVEEDSCQAVSTAVPVWLQEVTTSYHSDKNCSKLLQELALDPQSNPGFSLQSGILR